jgi:hypothetical protein
MCPFNFNSLKESSISDACKVRDKNAVVEIAAALPAIVFNTDRREYMFFILIIASLGLVIKEVNQNKYNDYKSIVSLLHFGWFKTTIAQMK